MGSIAVLEKYSNVRLKAFWEISWNFSRVLFAYPVGKNCQDELSRHKSFQNPLDNSEVGSQGNVTFKTHIREFWLRSDVDSHIFSLKSTKSWWKNACNFIFFILLKMGTLHRHTLAIFTLDWIQILRTQINKIYTNLNSRIVTTMLESLGAIL